jgi:hypothetical protein
MARSEGVVSKKSRNPGFPANGYSLKTRKKVDKSVGRERFVAKTVADLTDPAATVRMVQPSSRRFG